MKAWHFVGTTLRDGRPVPKDGEALVHPGRVIPCEAGLHASLEPWDAFHYAPGATLCLVEMGKTICTHGSPVDKVVSNKRTIIVRMDATPLLRQFARQQALSVVHLYEPPQIIWDFLMGDDAARDAAGVAARAAAWDASRNAAWDAAWVAARAAAWDAVWAAARDAAWVAARAAAWDAGGAAARAAAWNAARVTFNNMVYDAFEDWL